MKTRKNVPNTDGLRQVKTRYEGMYAGQTVSGLIVDGAWKLMVEDVGKFAFCPYDLCPNGFMLCRRERRRHTYYWYAYRKIGGKTKKQYIGKEANIYDMQLMKVLFQRFESMDLETNHSP